MRLKEEIAIGEKYVAEYIEEMKQIESIIKSVSPQQSDDGVEVSTPDNSALRFLLKREAGRALANHASAHKKLASLKVKYLAEFERESSECNSHMAKMIKRAKGYANHNEPKAIIELVNGLVQKYEASADTLSQDEKNDIYFELGAHLKVIREKFNV